MSGSPALARWGRAASSVSLIAALAAAAIASYFFWLSGGGIQTGFSHDDLMYMSRSWREPLPSLLLDNLCFFAFPTSYRPLGGLFYDIFYSLFRLDPLPYRLCLLVFLLANIYLTYAVARRLSGSREIGALTALLGCYHWGLTPLYRDTGSCYEIFCFFFYFSAFLYYLRIRQQNRFLRPSEQVKFLVLLVCALNAKETAVSLPILIGSYELLYHPFSWHPRQVLRWLFREGRTMCWGVLFDLPFLIVKVLGPGGIGRFDSFAGPIRLSSYTHTLQHNLEGIFFAYGSGLFSGRNLAVVLLLLFLIAWRLRLPYFRFAVLFWLIGILPAAFGPIPADMHTLYIPLVGFSLCAATLVLQIRKLVWRRARPPGVATFALAALGLGGFYTIKGVHRVTPMDEQSARIASVIHQLRTVLPAAQEGAHILFLKDPFGNSPQYPWAATFITRLLYHDDTLSVDRLDTMPIPPDAARLKQYDCILTMDHDRLVLVSQVRPAVPPPTWSVKPLLQILLGAGLTIATALALGVLLINVLGLKLYSGERGVLAFVCGAALLSNIIFLLAAAGWARTGVFRGIAGLAFAGIVFKRRPAPVIRMPALSRVWRRLSACVVAAFSWYYISNAMAPEVSPDGVSYHLAIVSQCARAHGFPHSVTNFYESLSQGVEMLFLFAFSIGQHSAAALVHCAFLFLLPLAMVRYSQRKGMAAAGVCGALLTFAAPVVGSDGVIAYNDVAAATVAFATFYLLEIWTEERDTRLIALAGLCAGFAYAVKYTAGIAVVYGLAVVCFRTGMRRKREMVRLGMVFLLFAAVSLAPWMIRDWHYYGNPVAPFFNRIFPNPFVTVEFDEFYRSTLAKSNGLKLWEIPWDATVAGYRSCGLFGCVFLLAPVALLSLRKREGRQLMLAAVVFALPILGNKGSRFLIPAIPFLSLAMGMALARAPLLAAAVIVAHAITSWPAVVGKYANPLAWRLREAPWEAALRLVPEQTFISKHVPEYAATRMLDDLAPPNSRIFSFEAIAASYCTHDVTVGYGTAEGIRLRDTLWQATRSDYQPMWLSTFTFGARPLYGIRIVQTAAAAGIWKIVELTAMHAGAELAPSSDWRLTAKPFPWNTGLALDRRLMTYWRADRPLTPGMCYQVRFGGPRTIDSVRLECPQDQWLARMKLEGEVEPGRWEFLADPSVVVRPGPVLDLRRDATGEVHRSGIGYILTPPGGLVTGELAKDPAGWGLVKLGDAAGWALYRIQ